MGWIHADTEDPISWGNSSKSDKDIIQEKYYLTCAFQEARRAMIEAVKHNLPEIASEEDLNKLVEVFKGIAKSHPEYEDMMQDALTAGKKKFHYLCMGHVDSANMPSDTVWYLDPWFIAYRYIEDGKENEWTIRSDEPMTHKEAEERLAKEEEYDKRYVKMGDIPREFKIVKDSKDL